MTDQMQLSLLDAYIKNVEDSTEKKILIDIKNELSYRYPLERINPGSLCPKCNNYVDSKTLYCDQCGQCIA